MTIDVSSASPKVLAKVLAKVLVVDDHAISRMHIAAVFQDISCAVRQSGTAVEAITIASDWFPDVICMDIRLPDDNGLRVISTILSAWTPGRIKPVVIILTADESVIDKTRLAELQVAKVLVKPVSGQQLREIICLRMPGRVSEEQVKGSAWELRNLFKEELRLRMPELDGCMLNMEMSKAAGILHQLIASAAICQEPQLESDLRELDRECRHGAHASSLARYYTAFLNSARDFQFRTE